jgi:DNA polymerase/3'-5' exonuclease PolX
VYSPLPLNSPIPESEISLPKSVNLNEENETFVKKIRKTKSSNRVVPKRTLKTFPKPKRSTLIRKKSLYFYVGKNNINKLNKTITTRIEKHMDEIKKEIPEMIISFLKNTDSNPTTIKLLCKQ